MLWYFILTKEITLADFQIPDKGLLTSVDRAADSLLIYDLSATSLKRTTVNYLLDLTSHPLGLTDTQSPTNKTFDNTNTITALDTLFTLQDNSDNTKQARFQLSSITTGTTRTYTLPDISDTVATLTATQTISGKTFTSPTINNATIVNPTITVDSISEFSAANGVTIDGLNIKDSKLNTNNSVVTANITDSAVTYAKVADGFCVQMQYSTSSALSTGTTVIPNDDTVPQNTEGNEYMTLAITPKSATNIIVIEVLALLSNSGANGWLTGAVFQDSTAGALAVNSQFMATMTGGVALSVRHIMVAGTTSSTTFKFRAGSNVAGTTSFNGFIGARLFGATTKSSITVTEYKAS